MRKVAVNICSSRIGSHSPFLKPDSGVVDPSPSHSDLRLVSPAILPTSGLDVNVKNDRSDLND